MRILWITNIPSPYRVDFFNELGKSVDLTVLFERANASDRDSAWQDCKFENFTGIIMRGLSYASDSAFCPGVIRELKRPTSSLHGWAHPTQGRLCAPQGER